MKKTFEIDNKKYAVISPNAQARKESEIEHSAVFGDLLKKPGVLTRVELQKLIDNRGIWDSESRDKYLELNKVIAEDLKVLEGRGIKLSEAKELALKISDNRAKLNELMVEYRQFDDITADAQAEAAALNYLIFKCLVDDETGEQIYKTFDEYIENKHEPIAAMAYINMLQIEYGTSNELYKKLPENKFLLDWKFVDDELRFINKDGQLIDRSGKLVTEEGDYVEKEDIEEVEQGVFLDEDGNPLEQPE